MVSRKYTKDYKVEYTENAKGKLRPIAIYCGDYYNFVKSDHAVNKAKYKLLVFSVISLISIVSTLCFETNALRTMYVSLPHAVSLFPLSFLLMAVYNVFMLKRPYTREQNDKTVNRLKSSSLLLMIFTTLAFSMQIVNFIVDAEKLLMPQDVIYTCILLIAVLSSGYVFSLRNHFDTSIDNSK